MDGRCHWLELRVTDIGVLGEFSCVAPTAACHSRCEEQCEWWAAGVGCGHERTPMGECTLVADLSVPPWWSTFDGGVEAPRGMGRIETTLRRGFLAWRYRS